MSAEGVRRRSLVAVLLDAPRRPKLAKRSSQEIRSDSELARKSTDADGLLGFLEGTDDALGELGSLGRRLSSGPGRASFGGGLSASSRVCRRGHAVRRRSKGGHLGERGVTDGLDELVDELLGEPGELSFETVRGHGASDDITGGAAVVLGLDGRRTAA
jgi:hypothetical protein